jgi:hypothetical protein
MIKIGYLFYVAKKMFFCVMRRALTKNSTLEKREVMIWLLVGFG